MISRERRLVYVYCRDGIKVATSQSNYDISAGNWVHFGKVASTKWSLPFCRGAKSVGYSMPANDNLRTFMKTLTSNPFGLITLTTGSGNFLFGLLLIRISVSK